MVHQWSAELCFYQSSTQIKHYILLHNVILHRHARENQVQAQAFVDDRRSLHDWISAA